VENVARHKPLEQVKRPLIAEPGCRAPELVCVVQLADADGAGHQPRLENPRRRDAPYELPHLVVVDQRHERRYLDARL
jgi:hypothetical protein